MGFPCGDGYEWSERQAELGDLGLESGVGFRFFAAVAVVVVVVVVGVGAADAVAAWLRW